MDVQKIVNRIIKDVRKFQDGGVFDVSQQISYLPEHTTLPDRRRYQEFTPDVPKSNLPELDFKDFKGKGHTAATTNYLNQIESLKQQYASLTPLEMMGAKGKSILHSLDRLMQPDVLNALHVQKEKSDKNLSQAAAQKATDTIAAKNGQVAVKDLETGEVKRIDMADYVTSQNKYQALTNQSLYNEFDMGTSANLGSKEHEVIGHTYGQSEIMQHLNQSLSNLGTTSVGGDNTWIGMLGGKQPLTGPLGNALLGYVRYGTKTTKNKEQLDQVIGTTWDFLNDGMKDTLKADAASRIAKGSIGGFVLRREIEDDGKKGFKTVYTSKDGKKLSQEEFEKQFQNQPSDADKKKFLENFSMNKGEINNKIEEQAKQLAVAFLAKANRFESETVSSQTYNDDVNLASGGGGVEAGKTELNKYSIAALTGTEREFNFTGGNKRTTFKGVQVPDKTKSLEEDRGVFGTENSVLGVGIPLDNIGYSVLKVVPGTTGLMVLPKIVIDEVVAKNNQNSGIKALNNYTNYIQSTKTGIRSSSIQLPVSPREKEKLAATLAIIIDDAQQNKDIDLANRAEQTLKRLQAKGPISVRLGTLATKEVEYVPDDKFIREDEDDLFAGNPGVRKLEGSERSASLQSYTEFLAGQDIVGSDGKKLSPEEIISSRDLLQTNIYRANVFADISDISVAELQELHGKGVNAQIARLLTKYQDIQGYTARPGF